MKKMLSFLALSVALLPLSIQPEALAISVLNTVILAQAPQAPEVKPQKKLLVVTTVAPITNIVSNIAGDRVEIQGVIPEGTDSHTFEPRPSDSALLSRADLIIVNGLKLESPTEKLSNAVKPKDTKIYELGNNAITEKQWLYDFSFPKSDGKPNPHLWVNPKYAEVYAKLAKKQLSALDPEGASYYEANLKSYLKRLDNLDKVTRSVVASIPAKNRKLLTYHDSWAYWAREYGFEVIGAIQPSDFAEPSAKEVARLIDQVRKVGVPAIFGSEVYPSKVEEQISREAKIKTANTADDDLPGEGSAVALENKDPQHTYIGMMAENLRIIASNLGGNPKLADGLDPSNVVGPAVASKTSRETSKPRETPKKE
jgi:ABC-type Zn uptake system ZnuABC Zn-binding protein ZnuA